MRKPACGADLGRLRKTISKRSFRADTLEFFVLGTTGGGVCSVSAKKGETRQGHFVSEGILRCIYEGILDSVKRKEILNNPTNKEFEKDRSK